MPGFIEIPPLSTEISHHTRQVLNKQWMDSWKTSKQNAFAAEA